MDTKTLCNTEKIFVEDIEDFKESVLPTSSQTDSNSDIDANKGCSTFGFDDSTKSDLVLLVEDTKFHVSKLVLSIASPVFDKMFSLDFEESRCTELNLPGKKAEDVAEFLRCIYPNTIKQINRENALQILPLIEEYQVFQLKPKCEEVLMDCINENTSARDLFKLIDLSYTYDLKNIRKKCVELASGKKKVEIDEARREVSLSPDIVVEILDGLFYSLHLKNTQTQTSFEQCLLGQFKFSEELNLDRSLKWDQKVVAFDIDICGDFSTETNFTIWNEPFKLSLTRSVIQKQHNDFNSKRKDSIKMELQCVNRTECYFHMVYFVVNKLGKKSNICVRDKCVFKKYDTYHLVKSSFATEIAMCDYKDLDEGYVQNNIATVLALLYMSKPW